MKKNKNAVLKTNKKKNAKNNKDTNNSENSIINYLKPKSSETSILQISHLKEGNQNQINYQNYNNTLLARERTNSNSSNNNLNLNNNQNLNVNRNNNPLNVFIKSEVPPNYTRECSDNYKKKIIIDDVFIDNFINLSRNSFKLLENEFIEICEKEGLNFFNKNSYDILNQNMHLLIVKFFLHVEDYFFYVPNILTDNKFEDIINMEYQKNKIKLFEGFQNSIDICLQYHPTSSKEIFYEGVSDKLIRYLKKFSNRAKKNNKIPQKVFVIYDDTDYLESQKIIEAVCNDLDFYILKIDDLENKKLLKFQKISEATQSQRLNSISDILNEKLGVLEKILNNANLKFISFFNQETKKLNDLTISTAKKEKSKSKNNGGTSSSSNSNLIPMKEITTYFNQDTRERKIYNLIKDNILKFLKLKKTLILLNDTFANVDEAKTYINNIMTKINDSKCPIVILTS